MYHFLKAHNYTPILARSDVESEVESEVESADSTTVSADSTTDSVIAVFEIKGAPCTQRAHFHDRVHDFRRCAPGVCTFFEPFIIGIHWEGA